MEFIGEGLAAIGKAVGSVAMWWGLVQIGKTAAITFLVSKCAVPFEKVSKFFDTPKRDKNGW